MAYPGDTLDLAQLEGFGDGELPMGQCPPYPPAFGDCPPHPPAFVNDTYTGADAPHGFADVSFAGDYYRESDDVVRGVVLGDLYAGGLGSSGGAWGEHGKDLSGPVLYENDLGNDFIESMQPREAPWGGVADTSVLIPRSSASAAEIAAAVKTFLRVQMTANIVKVNSRKFTIRAVVLIQHIGKCDIKAYVWDLPDEDAFALELRRRSGDSLAFGQVFQQMAMYVDDSFQKVRAVNGGSLPMRGKLLPKFLPPPTNPNVRPLSEEDYAPLVEIAKDGSTTPEAKMEAIGALHGSQSHCAAAAACLGSVLAAGVLEALLRDPQPQVAASAELLAAEIDARPHCYA